MKVVLTPREKRLLRLRAVGVTLFGLAIGGVTAFFLFFSDLTGAVGLPVILFAVFFFGILGFILFVHIRNGFQQEKTVITGRITDKQEHTTTYRKEIGQTRYTLFVDERPFPVDLSVYNRAHTGDRVELHRLNTGTVFELHVVEPAVSETPQQPEKPMITAFTEHAVPSGKRILLHRLFTAFLLRVCLGGFVGYVLVAVLNLVVWIAVENDALQRTLFPVIFYGIIAGWILLNSRTVRLLLDVITGKTRSETARVRDLQSGNLPKPSRNSVRTYQGFYYRNDRFYYAQTDGHWLEIPGELYRQLKTGDQLVLHFGAFSGTVLHVEVHTF